MFCTAGRNGAGSHFGDSQKKFAEKDGKYTPRWRCYQMLYAPLAFPPHLCNGGKFDFVYLNATMRSWDGIVSL